MLWLLYPLIMISDDGDNDDGGGGDDDEDCGTVIVILLMTWIKLEINSRRVQVVKSTVS